MTIASTFEEPGLRRARMNTTLVAIAVHENGVSGWPNLLSETSRYIERQPHAICTEPSLRTRPSRSLTDLGIASSLQRSRLFPSPYARRSRLGSHAGFEWKHNSLSTRSQTDKILDQCYGEYKYGGKATSTARSLLPLSAR